MKRLYVREAGVNRPVIRDGELCLVPKPGLLAAVWDSVMAIPEFIQRKPGRGMYIIPVLGLPDMEENEAIRDMAARRHVEVIFGKADWVQRLVDLASCHSGDLPGIVRHAVSSLVVSGFALVVRASEDFPVDVDRPT